MDVSPPNPDARPASRRVHLLVTSAVLGVCVAGAAIAFLAASQAVAAAALGRAAGYVAADPEGESALIPLVMSRPLHPWLLIPIAACGGLVVGWIATRLAPDAAGPGTDLVVKAYHDPNGHVSGRQAIAKIAASAITIGTGGSGGREGPMVQVGAAVGSWLANRLRFDPGERRLLLAAGMGAGVAAVFRTPLAGALFASEVLYRSEDFESEVLIPAGTAAVAADATAGVILGWAPLLPAPAMSFTSPSHLAAYALLAVAMAILARTYVAAFHTTTAAFRRLRIPGILKPAIGAAASALLAVALYRVSGDDPSTIAVLGFGLGTLQEVVSRPEGFAAGLLLAIGVGKLATTCLTIGSGGSGGIFGPALIIGGGGGGALGIVLQPLGPLWVPPPSAFVLLGMAGFFAAAAKTPFSTLLIVCELTGDFGLIPPALAVCVGSFVLSGPPSLFASQLRGRTHSPAHQFRDGADTK